MTATAAKGSFPYPHRTVAEVWGSKPTPNPVRLMLPVPVIKPYDQSHLIDLRGAPSSMEARAAGWGRR